MIVTKLMPLNWALAQWRGCFCFFLFFCIGLEAPVLYILYILGCFGSSYFNDFFLSIIKIKIIYNPSIFFDRQPNSWEYTILVFCLQREKKKTLSTTNFQEGGMFIHFQIKVVIILWFKSLLVNILQFEMWFLISQALGISWIHPLYCFGFPSLFNELLLIKKKTIYSLYLT